MPTIRPRSFIRDTVRSIKSAATKKNSNPNFSIQYLCKIFPELIPSVPMSRIKLRIIQPWELNDNRITGKHRKKITDESLVLG